MTACLRRRLRASRRLHVTAEDIDHLMALHFAGFPGSNTDTYGFQRPDNLDDDALDAFWSRYFGVLAHRQKRWEQVHFDVKVNNAQADKKLKRFIRKGVPKTQRPMVWMRVSGAEGRMQAQPDLFRQLKSARPPDDVLQIIELDLQRTFPDNHHFSAFGRTTAKVIELRELLSAFACKHPEIGYCQGLNYVAGMLLLVLNDAEKAFWLLDITISALPGYYVKDMRGVHTDSLVLRDLIKQRSPALHAHLERLDVDMLLMTTKWFVCWFLESLPIETVMRIWDSLFFEGSKIFFRVALTLILSNKERILACDSFAAATGLFKQMIKDEAAIHCHNFMETIFTLPGTLSMSTIAQLRRQYDPPPLC